MLNYFKNFTETNTYEASGNIKQQRTLSYNSYVEFLQALGSYHRESNIFLTITSFLLSTYHHK